ncbi:hypothetical protein CRE_17174 [Caenorhabditis remanei]|uniref:Uncharacterized protein n=1 Tax=Caenorhabditis remanei TaxID=31234 RepID=E3M9U1_CAERE|nr:hypothetical protein CRE_17174 [Caenorhabditis remanei]
MHERSEPQKEEEDEEQEIETKKLSFNSLVVKDLSVTEPCRTVRVENEKLIKLSPSDQQYLLKLKVKIVLRENWQELFVHDQNWALFEVEHVCCAAVNFRVIFFS